MDEIETYQAEHRRIDALMDQLDYLIGQEFPPEPIGFLHFRRELGRLLTQHLKREDWSLYPRLRASPCRQLRETAERFSTEVGALEANFAAYSRQWTTIRIDEDWPSFRRATAALLTALRQRIQLEEAELYPLLRAAARH